MKWFWTIFWLGAHDLLFVFLILRCQDGHETRDWMIECYATVDASQIAQICGLMKGETEHLWHSLPSSYFPSELLLHYLPSPLPIFLSSYTGNHAKPKCSKSIIDYRIKESQLQKRSFLHCTPSLHSWRPHNLFV